MSSDKQYFNKVIKGFSDNFNYAAKDLFVAPGRVEIIGNHTDHQHGRTLSMTVDKYIYAAVSPTSSTTCHIYNEGYNGAISVDLADLDIVEEEFGTSMALVRGVAHYFKTHGFHIGAFDAYSFSSIPRGMGMSSSAAFEVFVAQVFNYYYNGGKISELEIAKASQYAEQVYFNKPCGLLDQMTISYGGLVYCDFNKQENPVIAHLEKLSSKLHFFVIDTGKNHTKLTEHYALITQDLAKVAEKFGQKYMIDVNEVDFVSKFDALSLRLGERPVKRALHIFEENKRVIATWEALSNKDNKAFLNLLRASGLSSRNYLQNLTYPGDPDMALIKCFDKLYKKTQLGVRVNGGGFAGTLIAVSESLSDIDKINMFLEKENIQILPVSIAKYKAGHVKELA